MSPEGDKILGLTAMRLATVVAPALSDSYAQSSIGLLNFMLTLVAKEYERGADVRASENADIREAFAELTPLVADNELKAQLASAARDKDTSLRISALNASNYELRKLLIRLQAHLEEQDGPKARAAEKRIWQLLKAIAARRMVSLAP
jgi:hypothetical protein